MPKSASRTHQEILAEILERPTVPLWPHAGTAYGLGRDATYKAAHAGQIEVVRMGRLLKAVTAPMRKRLGMGAAA